MDRVVCVTVSESCGIVVLVVVVWDAGMLLW